MLSFLYVWCSTVVRYYQESHLVSLIFPSSLHAVGKEHILSSGQSKGKMVLQQIHHAGSLPKYVITDDGGQAENPGSFLCKDGQGAGKNCTAP